MTVCLAEIQYPETRQVPLSETLHGVQVEDPYRWLEDDQSEETKAWVTTQNKFTQDYLSTLPQRDAINKRLKNLKR